MLKKKLFVLFLLTQAISLPTNSLEAVVKIIPRKDVPYEELVITDRDKTKIKELIDFLADNWYDTLLWRREHARHLGQQVNSVYPLKFLAFCLNNLKPQMQNIFGDTLKRWGFMDGPEGGLSISLDREQKKGTLKGYIQGFSKEVGVDASLIEPYFTSEDWYGLVDFLVSR